jgi:hypothetical protein
LAEWDAAVFRFRLYTAMGGDDGEVELSVPTVEPGETLHLGGGRKLLVLDVAYLDDKDDRYPALLTVEELA